MPVPVNVLLQMQGHIGVKLQGPGNRAEAGAFLIVYGY